VGLRDRLREGYKRLAERETVARDGRPEVRLGKLTGLVRGLAKISPRPQALNERPERLPEHEGHARFPGEISSAVSAVSAPAATGSFRRRGWVSPSNAFWECVLGRSSYSCENFVLLLRDLRGGHAWPL
jgi:hypothetical protein